MLDRLISAILPSDPVEMLLNYIEGEEVEIKVGQKLLIKLLIKKQDVRTTEDGKTFTTYTFSGTMTRGG